MQTADNANIRKSVGHIPWTVFLHSIAHRTVSAAEILNTSEIPSV